MFQKPAHGGADRFKHCWERGAGIEAGDGIDFQKVHGARCEDKIGSGEVREAEGAMSCTCEVGNCLFFLV